MALPLPAQLDLEALDTYLEQARQTYEMPGLAVAVVADTGLVFAKGYGMREVHTRLSVTPRSTFGIASCSKAFTATAVALLVEEGKLGWDDRVIDYLPDFRLHDPYVTRELRVRDLLCHRTGFNTFDGDLLWYGSKYTRQEVAERIRHLPLKNSLRYRFGYSNIMFIVAGELIEAVSGQTWDAFLATRIFTPLGMDRTLTSVEDLEAGSEQALPYVHGEVFPTVNYDNAGPAASLNSNLLDLSPWVQTWLNQGEFEGNQVFSPQSYQTLTSAHTAMNPGQLALQQGTNFEAYALGWSIFDYEGQQVVEHDGGLPGYISKVSFMPEAQLGLIVLCNGMPILLHEAIRNYVYDHHLGTRNIDWVGQYHGFAQNYERYLESQKAQRAAQRIPDTQPAFDLEAYVGTYVDQMYGEAEVTLEKGELNLTLLPTAELFSGPLSHWHHDTFAWEIRDPYLPQGRITFELDAAGEISGFTIDLPNPDFHFYNLKFEKKGAE